MDTVIFDIGNVLIPWRPETLYERLIENSRERAWFLENVCTAGWNLEQDRGRPVAEAVAERVMHFPEHEALIRAYYERWPEMLGPPIADNVALLYELKEAGIRLYALSNFSKELFPYVLSRHAFFECFDGRIISGEEGVTKPDAAIYQRLLARYDVSPEGSVFIDDNVGNVEAARRLGMRGILFEATTVLREELRKEGVLLAEHASAF